MEYHSTTKLDEVRTSIVNQDAQKLHEKFREFETPFHYLLQDTSHTSHEISKLFFFLSPPIDVENINIKRKKPHYLLFIIDVLERLKLSCQLLLTRTSLQKNEELHNNIIKYPKLAEDLIRKLNQLTPDFPSLSADSFIKELQKRAGRTPVKIEALQHQIGVATEGFSTIFPIYGSFFDPYIHTPTEKDWVFIENYALMLGLVWNVIFTKPELLNDKINISINLRKTMELDLLRSNSIFTEIENISEVISRLRQEKGATQIKKYLQVFYAGMQTRQSNNRQANGFKRQTGKHRQRFRYINLPAQMMIIDEEDDFQIIQLKQQDFAQAEDPESWSDLSADENVSEEYFVCDPKKETIHNTERLGLNNRFALAYIRKINQGFADLLSVKEWLQLKSSLKNKIETLAHTDKKNLEKISALAIVQVGFLTGQSLRQAYSIKVLNSDLAKASSQLISVSGDGSNLYIPFNISYTERFLKKENQNYKTDSFLKIPVPKSVQNDLKVLIDEWSAIHQNLKLSQNSTSPVEPNMSCDNKMLKATLASVTKGAEVDERVSASFIEKFVRYNYLKAANGDFWVTSIFSSRNQSLGSTQKHYTTIINDYIYKTYETAIQILFSETLNFPDLPNPKSYIGIGNPARPLKHLVVSELITISEWLKPALKADLSKKSDVELITILNTMTLFFETYTSFFNGVRDIRNPYVYKQQIDSDGFTLLADKVIAGGYNSRQVCALSFFQSMQVDYEHFIRQLIDNMHRRKRLRISDLYSEGLNTMARWRSIHEPSNRFYGFFLIDPSQKRKKQPKYKVIPYTRTAARKLYLKSDINPDSLFFTLTTNSNRHFLRSSLIERGVNPEYVDEYMGHRHFGTESWNEYALTNTPDFRTSVKTELKKILKDFGQISPFCRENE